MWEFIKYCFKCLGIVIAGSFGYNPTGLTWKTGIVGVVTLFVLIGLFMLSIYILYLITNKNK